MKLFSCAFVLSTTVAGVFAAIPDQLVTDANKILVDIGNFYDASRFLPVDGYVEKSLVLAFDASSLTLRNDLQTAYYNVFDAPSFNLEDSISLFRLITPIQDEIIEALIELQTKTAFRSSYSTVALSDLTAQRSNFVDYVSNLGTHAVSPVNWDFEDIRKNVTAAYNSAIAYFKYQTV